jgi:hypothetical protein
MARARTNGFDFVYERVETRSPRSRFLAVGSSLAPGQKPVGVRAWSAGRDGTGWDGTGWDGIGWDGIGWDGTQTGRDSNGTGLKRDGTQTGRDSNGTGARMAMSRPDQDSGGDPWIPGLRYAPTWAIGSGLFRT